MQTPIIINNFLTDKECEYLYTFGIEQYRLKSKLYVQPNLIKKPLLVNIYQSEIKDMILSKFRKLLTEDLLSKFDMKRRNIFSTSWWNIFEYEVNMLGHQHANEENRVITMNLFIGGPTEFGQWYSDDKKIVEDIPGKLTILDGYQEHSVGEMVETGHEMGYASRQVSMVYRNPRISMVFDFVHISDENYHQHMSVNNYLDSQVHETHPVVSERQKHRINWYNIIK